MINFKIAVLTTHPIQYYSPWFAHLSKQLRLHVYYTQPSTPEGQAAAGFATAFDWDLPLLNDYKFTFLNNIAKRPSIQGFWGCNTPEISALLRKGNYDALLMFGWNKLSMLQAWRAALMLGLPILIRTDSHLETPRSRAKLAVKWPVYRALLPHFADYLSPGVRADAYLRHYRVPDSRIHRVPHMIDVDRFATNAQKARRTGSAAALREINGAGPNNTVILMVGKTISLKRHHLMLDAIARLGAKTNVRLWIVGDGPLDAELDARIAQESLPVRRIGFVNQAQLPTYYAAADCLALISKYETWGLVVNEAQACGLPSIVAEQAGCAPELIEDGVTGWTLRTDGPEELAKLLQLASEARGHLNKAPIEAKARLNSYSEGTRLITEVIQRVMARRTGSNCASLDQEEMER